MESLGLYISVPFCRAKCTYCNFASGVFGAERMDAYLGRVCAEMRRAPDTIASFSPPRGLGRVDFPERADSIYLGGGTPSLRSAGHVQQLFAVLREQFAVSADAEITLECAPGQLSDETLQAMLHAGVNRVSFGVQSFVDREAAAVGRLHTRAICEREIARMRAEGVDNINVDLIVGLPRQTSESLSESVEVGIASGVPHVSVYMLEIDEDSRLGREALTRGAKYGASDLPSEDETAEWYAKACEWLEEAGIEQYEISNFARAGYKSRHNMRYWRRGPYLGFGLDAHSMLRSGAGGVRWANAVDLDAYLETGNRGQGTGNWGAASKLQVLLKSDECASGAPEWIGREQAFEEEMFLGLRMNRGVDLDALRREYGAGLVASAAEAAVELEQAGLLEQQGQRMRLTAAGRVLSNEVFGRLLLAPAFSQGA